MNKVYKGQTELKLRVDVGVDIQGATSTLIKYKKPDGSTGSFAASIEDAFEGIIFYDVLSSNDLDVVGKWTFWAYIVFLNGNEAPGCPYTLEVFEEGSIC